MKLSTKGIRLKLSKCCFGQREISTLEFKVSHKAVVPGYAHVKTMSTFPDHENGTSLLRFLGVANYLGRFIERAAERMAPLYKVFQGTAWNKRKRSKRQAVAVLDFASRWGEEQRMAFYDIRQDLAAATFLTEPRRDAPKRLVTDASTVGLGAVLLQWEGEEEPPTEAHNDERAERNGWRPVVFLCRALKGVEPRWTVTELECAAVVWAIKKLRHHLDGAHFTVVTDHSTLTWLMNIHQKEDP